MVIDFYATDGTTLTPTEFHEGTVEEAKLLAVAHAKRSFPEWVFGFPVTVALNVQDVRIVEYLAQ